MKEGCERPVPTDAFHFSAACTKMYTNGTCPWSVWSSVLKSIDMDFSTSAGQGLSTRNETFSSEWVSMTVLSLSVSFYSKGREGGREGAYQYVHDIANKIPRESPRCG